MDEQVKMNTNSEKINLNVNVEALRYDLTLSGPGYFLHHLADSNPSMPWVVMPNGHLYTLSTGGKYEFLDPIAQAYAEQNNGIFFASREHKEPARFKLSDYIKALRILTVNNAKIAQSREGADKLIELVNKTEKDSDLVPDSKYLVTVKPIIFGSFSSNYGLEGVLVDDQGKEKMFGGANHEYQFSVKLSLALPESFGYQDFDIVGRRLTAELLNHGDLCKKSMLNTASSIANRFHMSFSHETTDGNWEKAILSYQAPRYNLNMKDRSETDPIMPTEQMLGSFLKVATSIKTFLEDDTKKRKAKMSKKNNLLARRLVAIVESNGLKVPPERT
jgi:hypothetical protein